MACSSWGWGRGTGLLAVFQSRRGKLSGMFKAEQHCLAGRLSVDTPGKCDPTLRSSPNYQHSHPITKPKSRAGRSFSKAHQGTNSPSKRKLAAAIYSNCQDLLTDQVQLLLLWKPHWSPLHLGLSGNPAAPTHHQPLHCSPQQRQNPDVLTS